MSSLNTYGVDRAARSVVVPANTTSNPVFVPSSCVVSAAPGAGGTMTAEASFSTPDDVKAGVAKWHAWNNGAVSAEANQHLLHATAVRFVATGAQGVGEVSR